MGFDIEAETVRVLTEGLEVVPTHLDRGQTAAFARWASPPFGAVFFIRRWQNDEFDTDLAITSQDSAGRWQDPLGYGGGGFWNPFERPEAGWEGDPVIWGGESAAEVGEADSFTNVRAFEGMASPEWRPSRSSTTPGRSSMSLRCAQIAAW